MKLFLSLIILFCSTPVKALNFFNSGGGDNLGTHKATKNLDLDGFGITNMDSISGTGSGPAKYDSATNSTTFAVNGSATSSYQLFADSMTRTGGHSVLDSGRLAGTSNQVIISSASLPLVTLSLPQSIATTSQPQFATLGLGLAATSGRFINIQGQTLSMTAQKVGNYQEMTATTGGAADMIGTYNLIKYDASATSAGGVYGFLADAQSGQGTLNGGLYGGWMRAYIFSGATVSSPKGLEVRADLEAGATATNMYGVQIYSNILGTNSNYRALDILAPGAGKTALIADSGNVILNEAGLADSDFRVESDSNTHMLFEDSSANAFGINNASPVRPLDIVGAMRLAPQASAPGSPASGDIYVDSTPNPDALCFYNGTDWDRINAGGAGDADCN